MLERNPYEENDSRLKESSSSVAAINMESLLLRINLLGEDLGAHLKDLEAIFSIFSASLQP